MADVIVKFQVEINDNLVTGYKVDVINDITVPKMSWYAMGKSSASNLCWCSFHGAPNGRVLVWAQVVFDDASRRRNGGRRGVYRATSLVEGPLALVSPVGVVP